MAPVGTVDEVVASLERLESTLPVSDGVHWFNRMYLEVTLAVRDYLAHHTQEATRRMRQPSCALPILFSVEYALARLLMEWGVRPQAMIGHSLGEYVAACLAEVFSLEDALSLVVVRGRLFEQLPDGSMLSVPLPEAEIRSAIERFGQELSIAAVNGPSQCVVSGTVAAIDGLAEALAEDEIEFRRIGRKARN